MNFLHKLYKCSQITFPNQHWFHFILLIQNQNRRTNKTSRTLKKTPFLLDVILTTLSTDVILTTLSTDDVLQLTIPNEQKWRRWCREDVGVVRDHGREAQQRFGLLRRSAFAHLRVRAHNVVLLQVELGVNAIKEILP